MTIQEHYLFKQIETSFNTYLHYKRDQDRVLYFAGTIFILIISATGILGIYRPFNIELKYNVVHALFFHLMFTILYFYYIHKSIISEFYLLNAVEAEKYLLKNYKINNIPSFSEQKNKVLGNTTKTPSLKKINTGYFANIGLLILYMLISLYPLMEDYIKNGAIELIFFIPLINILIIILFAKYYSKKKRNVVKEKVKLIWNSSNIS